jgi:hypothetical protein
VSNAGKKAADQAEKCRKTMISNGNSQKRLSANFHQSYHKMTDKQA